MNAQILVRPSLALSKGYPAAPFYLAVYFQIEPDWHLYWKNPGDTGLSIQADIKVNPPYVVAGSPIYPVPHFLKDDSGVSYIYYNETLLLIPITPPTDIDDLPDFSATVALKWLVCREKCLTGGDTLVLKSSEVLDTTLAEMQHRIETLMPTFPKKMADSPIQLTGMRMGKVGQESQIVLKFDKELPENTMFYPEEMDDHVIFYDQIRVKEKQIIVPMVPVGDKKETAKILRGLLLIDHTGYELNVPVEK